MTRNDRRLFPWGNQSADDGSRCPPLQMGASGDDQSGLANVTAYPAGASPFGVLDMVGNGEWVLICAELSILGSHVDDSSMAVH